MGILIKMTAVFFKRTWSTFFAVAPKPFNVFWLKRKNHCWAVKFSKPLYEQFNSLFIYCHSLTKFLVPLSFLSTS